ncbi:MULTISPECIES: hypothetical protein [unclassified Paraburkholderia]|uniref:hypothetical protein n=1 Tax=unclassified Paraburkholderia TaxID=2615204 RepID=UPI002AB1447C|nr:MULTISPECIES: hypothetical protein [unclassified Paraburkholderia]
MNDHRIALGLRSTQPMTVRFTRLGARLEAFDISAFARTAPSMDVLSDLARFGVVGALAELAPGRYLWPRATPAGGKLAFPADDADSVRASPRERIYVGRHLEKKDDRWRYSVLTRAREMRVVTGLPMTNLPLLSLLQHVCTQLPHQAVAALPPADHEGFIAQLAPGVPMRVARHAGVLQERRRIALGLGQGIPPRELEAQIRRCLIAPMAQQQLNDLLPDTTRCIRVIATDDVAAQAEPIPMDCFSPGDPMGENLYALAQRRIARMHAKRIPVPALWKPLSRIVASLAGSTEETEGAAQSMLALIQMGY